MGLSWTFWYHFSFLSSPVGKVLWSVGAQHLHLMPNRVLEFYQPGPPLPQRFLEGSVNWNKRGGCMELQRLKSTSLRRILYPGGEGKGRGSEHPAHPSESYCPS